MLRLSRHVLMWARPAIMRRDRASTGISSEKIMTGWRLPRSDLIGTPFMSCPSAQHSAMFIASEVLPTDGRAAMTIISDFFSPWSFSSRCVSPVASPSKEKPSDLNISLMRSKLAVTASPHGIVFDPVSPISRKARSASPRIALGSGHSPSL